MRCGRLPVLGKSRSSPDRGSPLTGLPPSTFKRPCLRVETRASLAVSFAGPPGAGAAGSFAPSPEGIRSFAWR
jgi:hypothetical protein